MKPVRIGPECAIPVFALSFAAGYAWAFHRAPGGDDALDMLPVIGVAGALTGALVGLLIVPWFGYPHVWRAMLVGAISAVVSHLPFSLLFALVDALAGGTAPTADGIMRIFQYTLLHGAEIVFLPSVAFGAVAGAAGHLLSRRRASANG